MLDASTPRPWIRGTYGGEIMAEFIQVRAPRTGAPIPPKKVMCVVARVYAWGGQPEDRPEVLDANIDLVVEAVNNYNDVKTENEELKKILRGVLRRFDSEYHQLTDGEHGKIEAFREVKKAYEIVKIKE